MIREKHKNDQNAVVHHEVQAVNTEGKSGRGEATGWLSWGCSKQWSLSEA